MRGTDIEKELSQIKGLLKQNLEYTKQALEQQEKTKRYIIWLKIVNLIKLLVILVPIILALLYLPPVLRDFFEKYKELFGPGGFFIEYFNK